MIAQVNEVVDELPRIDIPADWVDFVVTAPRPNYIEPLFTRDPRADQRGPGADGDDGDQGHLRRVRRAARSNHGIGFDTAAIELLLPTYGERWG